MLQLFNLLIFSENLWFVKHHNNTMEKLVSHINFKYIVLIYLARKIGFHSCVISQETIYVVENNKSKCPH